MSRSAVRPRRQAAGRASRGSAIGRTSRARAASSEYAVSRASETSAVTIGFSEPWRAGALARSTVGPSALTLKTPVIVRTVACWPFLSVKTRGGATAPSAKPRFDFASHGAAGFTGHEPHRRCGVGVVVRPDLRRRRPRDVQARLNLRAPKLVADHASRDPHVGAIAAKRSSDVGGPAPAEVESDHRLLGIEDRRGRDAARTSSPRRGSRQR